MISRRVITAIFVFGCGGVLVSGSPGLTVWKPGAGQGAGRVACAEARGILLVFGVLPALDGPTPHGALLASLGAFLASLGELLALFF